MARNFLSCDKQPMLSATPLMLSTLQPQCQASSPSCNEQLPHQIYMYPTVTFWWLKACCDRGRLLHPCEAALFRPRPHPGGCPDFRGKIVAFAGLSKAPSAFQQYMKETVLVLGCSWSGEMHKDVHVLVNCLPPLCENDKITWTYVN